MDDLKELLANILNERLVQIVLSDSKDKEAASKVKVRPVLLKDRLVFQETLYRGTQVFHHNYDVEEVADRIYGMLVAARSTGQELPCFGQAQLVSLDQEATVLVSKKGKMTIKRKKLTASGLDAKAGTLAHNKTKQYILQEGKPVDFLIGLGVQSPDGKVTKAKYDKFRQINRYLEFIEDVLTELPADRTIRIIDFGCGKSYLTFAMYYYLHVLNGRDIQVTGLDLKADVIDHCNELAAKCGYDKLHFEKGDISTYTGTDQVDMVVTLHACDTATDYALEKAIKWGAKVIMAVPCCQHEVNRQIHCDALKPVLQYGLIKERMSALITDAVRAELLAGQGYDTQILEFIDMEHTPKNLLIRAVKRKGMRPNKNGDQRKTDVNELMEYLSIAPTLLKLLEEIDEEDNH
ncbi:MAG: SAM-dependent methyltransferase [Lachnospiraceae bacterium]|nr:SAM-dependent methyltransferase [Lachnospiraceae bacterium]